ncbi:ParB/RepB/Spo0J family partition protein [Cellulosimicrobium terreum]|nr:ParB/RepB/Spo0J family partition protein [Cellulosimicrobium terreum]
MSEKRRGLGRGLGALIPTSSEGKRPVDVFFPSAVAETDESRGDSAAPAGTGGATDGAQATEAPDGGVITVERDASPADVAGFATVTVDELDSLVEGAEPSADDEKSSAGHSENSDSSEVASDSASAGTAALSAEAETETETDNARGAEPDGTGLTSVDVSRGTDDASSAALDDVSWTGQAAEDLVPVPGARFAEVPVDSIRPNPMQPRTVFDEAELDELIGSIREIGVLQPIVVRPAPGDGGSYELIMGERRWRATQAAGLDTIPAIVRETDDSDLLRDALLENLHRSALNPLEEAAAYRQLLDDFGCTHEELAERISRSRPQISNTLRLLRLPPLVQRRVAAGVLSAGHARALLGLSDGGEIERLAQRIVAEGLSVRATEEIVAMGESNTKAPRVPRAGQRSAAIDELATRLSDRFETRVKVDLGAKKGRLTVEFASVEDLNRILDLMAPQDPGLLRR